uniref:NADH-ubiquinone oxidoreductase chain 5 n=1 Tax=Elaeidobius kamerunicus TaxID=2663966 RepID=A0A7D5YIZ8_9CUCU|nr:NADH dehydrogenase subunit 5 [Elaeidobius kamerunicus]QLI52336.1 NADH dehydrogenase subunit 5 [Elaeidobius kamerunicus]
MCNVFFLLFLFISLSLYFSSLFFMMLELEVFIEFSLLYLNSFSLVYLVVLDWVSLMFMSFVLFISSMIIKYSDEYMHGDKKLNRFIMLMILFVCSMMFMILSPNLISILLGWDGLGLVSYALVIYYQNVKSFNAGMLTALSNRIGDAALLMSIALMSNFGGWNLLNYMDFYTSNHIMMMISFFIILAAITKSAQIPFSSWLPAAMAAPTPVSSLVHSSTLVTAGVYLLIRFSPSFPSSFLDILLYLSLFTMFMAGLGANFEFDLKKIIALSTLSQLGMMMTILCLGNTDLAFFHLLIHALFKALLFMCAGAIIHNLGNCQDIRYMGGIISFLPLTCTCMNISNFALCGIPFLSGFYSKDLVAEAFSMEIMGIFTYLVFFISIGLTVSYTIRLSYYVMFGDFNSISMILLSDNNNKIMLKGMIGLVFLVIFKGSLLSWLFFSTPYLIVLPFYMKIMTLIMIIMGAFLGYEFSQMKYFYLLKAMFFYHSSMFFSGMWNLPILSTFGVNSYFLNLGKIYTKNFDQGWMEYYGSKNLFWSMKSSSMILQLLSRNHLKVFLLLMFMFMLFLILFIL